MIPADLEDSLNILENALGLGYVSRDKLATYAGREDKVAFVAIGEGNQIHGIVTSDLPAGSDDVLELLPSDAQARVLSLIPELAFNRTGLLRSGAVSPQSRGNGIVTSLSKASVGALEDMGATSILAIGWTDFEGCHIQRILEAMGFKTQGDLENFWHEDSISKNYQCPTCGKPCFCTARIFLKSQV